MRPRHVLILLLLTAIPIGLAIVLASGGGTRTVSGAPSANVTLALLGGAKGAVAQACGATRNYTAYPAGSTIRFGGAISAAGPWQVKVKLKACQAGSFQSAGDVSGTLRSNTSYAGSFPAPIAGYYFARTELKEAGALVARSRKAYFAVH